MDALAVTFAAITDYNEPKPHGGSEPLPNLHIKIISKMNQSVSKEKGMFQNPFLPVPSAENAWAEGFTKGFAAISWPKPSENVAAEDIDAL